LAIAIGAMPRASTASAALVAILQTLPAGQRAIAVAEVADDASAKP
jgi:hypothetical protein